MTCMAYLCRIRVYLRVQRGERSSAPSARAIVSSGRLRIRGMASHAPSPGKAQAG